MVEIIFETHSETTDNEAGLASGWYDVGLSAKGKIQAQALGERRLTDNFDVVFCSDLKRAVETYEIAFGKRKFKVIKDPRLRECNYGDLNKYPKGDVEPIKALHLKKPFPNGESYEETTERMRHFLNDLLAVYDNKKVLIIGHRATQYGLDHLIDGVLLKEAVTRSWRWQPGWQYWLTNKV